MRDRKAYWREYQRKRYAQTKLTSKASYLQPTQEQREQLSAAFKAAAKEAGWTEQRHWRKRRKLKEQLRRELCIPDSKNRVYWAQVLWSRAKTGAAARGLAFTISPEDLLLTDKCPIFKCRLNYSSLDNGGGGEFTPSVDRIDNARGYEPGNVQIVSFRANKLKNDATLEELVALGRWAKRALKASQSPTAQSA